MANNNQIYKMSNAGGFKSLNRYYDMLAGNTVWNPWSPDGAFDALATVTVPAGGVASVTFAGIPNTYKHLQLRGIMRQTATTTLGQCYIRFNGDSGNSYSSHTLVGDGSTASTAGTAGANQNRVTIGIQAGSSQTTGIFGATVVDILDYASVTKNKTYKGLSGVDANGSGYVWFCSGAWYNSSSAISSITLTQESTSFNEFSQFALYGIK